MALYRLLQEANVYCLYSPQYYSRVSALVNMQTWSELGSKSRLNILLATTIEFIEVENAIILR